MDYLQMLIKDILWTILRLASRSVTEYPSKDANCLKTLTKCKYLHCSFSLVILPNIT